jgi:N-acyl-L-homoserine lactone synthetase
MVLVVHKGNAARHKRELDAMFRDRKAIFIDMHKWNLVADGPYERDQFDGDDAVYLIAADPQTGAHLSSLRLLPTTGRTLLAEIFPQLCDGPPPKDADVWEVTRICFAPHLRGSARKEVFKQIALAAAEIGLLYGIRRYSVMAYLSFLPEVLAMGWESAPLGIPQHVDEREPVSAFTLEIDAVTLKKLREQWGVARPVLHHETYALEAA